MKQNLTGILKTYVNKEVLSMINTENAGQHQETQAKTTQAGEKAQWARALAGWVWGPKFRSHVKELALADHISITSALRAVGVEIGRCWGLLAASLAPG